MFTFINGRKIIARRFYLEALTKAHEEIVKAGVSFGGKLGFHLSDEITGGWRSEALQRQLYDKGSSKPMYSNHRRGTAVDCAADWGYIKKIRPYMNRQGLFNDLAYVNGAYTDDDPFAGSKAWDGGHWNFKSNAIAQSYDIINKLPIILNQFSMFTYDGQIIFMAQEGLPESGSFAGVYPNRDTHELEKHIIRKDRAGLAAIHPLLGGKKAFPVDKMTWDAIPTGAEF